MRVLTAGLRAVFVDLAVVVRIQERARCQLQDVVFVLVDSQVLFNKFTRFLPECFGSPLNIRLIKNRAGGLAAVGAGEAVNFFKDLTVNFVKGLVHHAGVFLLKTEKELAVFGFLICGAFLETKYIHCAMISGNHLRQHIVGSVSFRLKCSSVFYNLSLTIKGMIHQISVLDVVESVYLCLINHNKVASVFENLSHVLA